VDVTSIGAVTCTRQAEQRRSIAVGLASGCLMRQAIDGFGRQTAMPPKLFRIVTEPVAPRRKWWPAITGIMQVGPGKVADSPSHGMNGAMLPTCSAES
jgi:hypothetical protein